MKFSLVSCFGEERWVHVFKFTKKRIGNNIFQKKEEAIYEKSECATPFLIDQHGVSVRECGPPHVLAADPHVVALPEILKRSLLEIYIEGRLHLSSREYSNCANVSFLIVHA